MLKYVILKAFIFLQYLKSSKSISSCALAFESKISTLVNSYLLDMKTNVGLSVLTKTCLLAEILLTKLLLSVEKIASPLAVKYSTLLPSHSNLNVLSEGYTVRAAQPSGVNFLLLTTPFNFVTKHLFILLYFKIVTYNYFLIP